jgi:hypothetical protein
MRLARSKAAGSMPSPFHEGRPPSRILLRCTSFADTEANQKLIFCRNTGFLAPDQWEDPKCGDIRGYIIRSLLLGFSRLRANP